MIEVLLISEQKLPSYFPVAVAEFIDTSAKDLPCISELADKKIRKNSSRYSCVLINTEAIVNGSNRIDFKALELIFWLRLKYKYTGPIITYGFLSSAQVLRLKPQYVVLHAPGNMHWRLGDELLEKDIPETISEDVIKREYRPYMLPLETENKLRHENANKWALWKISNVYVKITKLRINKDILDLNSFKNTTEFLIESEIHKTRPEDGGDIDDRIKKVRDKLEPYKKRILLIDDMADSGWGMLLPKLLNCKEGEFESLPVGISDKPEEVASSVLTKLDESERGDQPINLILLDLRLKNEKGKLSIDKISGFLVLEELKKHRPDIPIIIITASNKLQTNKALENVGIWGIWTKEGQDNGVSNVGLRQSLLSLLRLVKKAFDHFKCPADHAIYGLKNFYIHKEDKLFDENREKVGINSYDLFLDCTPKIKLSEFGLCIVDTNVWMAGMMSCKECEKCKRAQNSFSYRCESKYFPRVDYCNRMKVLEKLRRLLKKNKTELIINNSIYSELREKARPSLNPFEKGNRDDNLIRTSSFALDLIDNEFMDVVDYDSRTYDKQAYADALIIEYLLIRALGLKDKNKKSKKPINVLLITNDNELSKKIQACRGYRSEDDKSSNTSIIVQSSEQMTKLLSKIHLV